MVRRLHAGFVTLPGLMRIGLLIVLIGGALDLVHHTLPLHWALLVDPYVGHDGWSLHMIALMGMVITLMGIFADKITLHPGHKRQTETERRPTSEY